MKCSNNFNMVEFGKCMWAYPSFSFDLYRYKAVQKNNNNKTNEIG